MKDDDRPAGGGRHAASAPPRRRRAPLLLAVATAVGVWLGVSAPEVSPVSAPAPAVQTPQAAPAHPAGGPAR
jgi:hypothetical protein